VPATIVPATAFLELWIDVLTSTAGRSNRPLVFGRGRNPINFVSVRDVAALVEHVVTDQEPPAARWRSADRTPSR
jgi:NADH dehydrogenase